MVARLKKRKKNKQTSLLSFKTFFGGEKLGSGSHVV